MFLKNTQIPNLMKMRSVGAELFHAYSQMDGQPDTTKLKIAFRNFAIAPKKGRRVCSQHASHLRLFRIVCQPGPKEM
jgi:hypothetical protein